MPSYAMNAKPGFAKNQLRRSGPKGLGRARGIGPDQSYNNKNVVCTAVPHPQLRGGVYSTLVIVSKGVQGPAYRLPSQSLPRRRAASTSRRISKTWGPTRRSFSSKFCKLFCVKLALPVKQTLRSKIATFAWKAPSGGSPEQRYTEALARRRASSRGR